MTPKARETSDVAQARKSLLIPKSDRDTFRKSLDAKKAPRRKKRSLIGINSVPKGSTNPIADRRKSSAPASEKSVEYGNAYSKRRSEAKLN